MQYLNTLLLMFFIYSFIGWIVEIIYTYIEQRKIINRGFLIGPFVPIYGVGVTIIYVTLTKYSNDPVVLMVMSMFVCGTIEYITSFLMEKIFKNRWWDYTHMKFNLNGRICLENCVLFGLGGLLTTYLINPYLVHFIFNIKPNILSSTVLILSILFIIDLCISFNIIIKLKNISSSINTDSTEVLTKKVKQILVNKTYPYRRLLMSFPNMLVFNKLSILKNTLNKTRKLLKDERIKIRKDVFKLLKRKNKKKK